VVSVRGTGRRVPRLPGLVAGTALAVAAIAAGTAGLALWWTPAEDPSTDDPATPNMLERLPDGTVPSVFAHTRESATALLQGMGQRVAFREEISCVPEGRPIGTDPATGTPVERGDTVTVLLAYQGPTTDCFADLSEPWRFMDFATARGPAPSFAEQVDLFVDGRPTRTLSGTDAALADWGRPSALTELRDMARQVLELDGEHHAPTLEVREGTPPDELCGVPRPAGLAHRDALTLTVEVPEDARPRCPARVSLYRTAGEIDAVVTWTERPRLSAATSGPVPDVVGLTLAEARGAVTDAGFTARIEELETCAPRDGVVEQAPTQSDLEEDLEDDPGWPEVVTLVVEVPHTSRDCAALDAAAATFVRFARGGPPPVWSPHVQQLFGYALRDRITAEQADDRSAWSFCTDTSTADCDLSPLVVAGAAEVETAEWRETSECELTDYGGLPSGLDPEDHIVLFPAKPQGCTADWAVELWIDGRGRVSAVNLLLARAAVSDAD
jgi:hypothetical protein